MNLFRMFLWPACCLATLTLTSAMACAEDSAAKAATSATNAAQERVLKSLPFMDKQSFKDARRGFIAALPDNGRIMAHNGNPTWDLAPYAFLQNSKAPSTVNPSLWRQAQLIMQNGLFKVADRIYQVRTADLANMTIIEGDTGIIIVDPLTAMENAAAALKLYYAHRPHRPVSAVIYSHSHVDHYGGALGVVSQEDVAAGRVRVIAPTGFMHAVTAENIMAGNVMSRRATYMYGNLLPPSPTGHVSAGLGLKTPNGSSGLLPPTELVERSGQKLRIDGLTFEFLLTPQTEAPAEMHWYIEELNALSAAENCTHTQHNIYTPRGAKARDPLLWAKALDATITRWGDRATVLYSMHHWPVWGRANINKMLGQSRDLYRYINDRTLNLANKGYSMTEIAEMVTLPPELERVWALRGYYGTLNNNIKGTYIYYLGWFDGNPLRLHPLPPQQAGVKYLEFMGGADAVVAKARESYARGEYRWVAQVLDHVIAAQPSHKAARELAADALEQMGYQAESGPWRNFFLTGAQELRHGVKELPRPAASPQSLHALDMDMLLDSLAVRLDAAKAKGKRLALRLTLTDAPKGQEQHSVWVGNSVLNHRAGLTAEKPDASLSMTRATLDALLLGQLRLSDAIKDGRVSLRGKASAFTDLLGMLETFPFWFGIVSR